MAIRCQPPSRLGQSHGEETRMARPLRIEFPGAVYHVIARGIEKRDIFRKQRDKSLLLSLLSLVKERHGFVFYAYCIMENHYHLLVRTPRANLSRGIRDINSIFAQSYNRANARCGPLFQGRHKAFLIEEESYLLVCARYIVLNPVRAGICAHPSSYPWCSYRATAGLSKSPAYLSPEPLLSFFSCDLFSARRQYREFISAGMDEDSPLKHKGGIVLGAEEFLDRIKEYIEPKRHIGEIPKEHRFQDRPSLSDIFADTAEKMARSVRNEKITKAFREYGYTQVEIGEYLGIDHSTVSLIIRAGEKG